MPETSNHEIAIALTRLEERFASMQKEAKAREQRHQEVIEDLKKDLNEARADIKDMKEMAGRWRGGFVVLAALGSIVSWVLMYGSKILTVLGGVR